MANLYFDKQPSEIFSIAVNFSDRLADEETISSVDVSAIDIATGNDATATVIDSSAIDGVNINIKVKAGTDDYSYKITIKITTSGSNIFEEEVIMHVVEE